MSLIFPLVLFLVATLLGSGYLIYRVKRAPGIFTTRSNRYLLYEAWAIASALFFGVIDEAFRNNWLFFLCLGLSGLVGYFNLVWLRLVDISNPRKRHRLEQSLLVRPLAAALLGLTVLFLLLSFVMAGPEAFETLSLTRPSEIVENFWLWLGVIVALGYPTASMLEFGFEAVRLAQKFNGNYQLGYKFRCYYFTLIAIAGFAFFGLSLLGLVVYGLTGWYWFELSCITLRNLVAVPLAVLVFVLLFFFERKLFAWYSSWYKQRLHNLVKHLRWLYEITEKLFPVSYRLSSKEVFADTSPEWSLEVVVNNLTDVRLLIWAAYAQSLAETESQFAEKRVLVKKRSAREEARIWATYMRDQEAANLALKLSYKLLPAGLVPQFEETGTEQLARYYVQLARLLQNLLKLQKQDCQDRL